MLYTDKITVHVLSNLLTRCVGKNVKFLEEIEVYNLLYTRRIFMKDKTIYYFKLFIRPRVLFSVV